MQVESLRNHLGLEAGEFGLEGLDFILLAFGLGHPPAKAVSRDARVILLGEVVAISTHGRIEVRVLGGEDAVEVVIHNRHYYARPPQKSKHLFLETFPCPSTAVPMHSVARKRFVNKKPPPLLTAGAEARLVEGRVGLTARCLVGLVHRLADGAFEHLQQGGPAGAVRDLEADQGQPVVGTTANQDGVREVHTALGLNRRAEAHAEGEELESVGLREGDVFHTGYILPLSASKSTQRTNFSKILFHNNPPRCNLLRTYVLASRAVGQRGGAISPSPINRPTPYPLTQKVGARVSSISLRAK